MKPVQNNDNWIQTSCIVFKKKKKKKKMDHLSFLLTYKNKGNILEATQKQHQLDKDTWLSF